jgi:hypothetical protein
MFLFPNTLTEGFRVKASIRQKLRNAKRRIQRRLKLKQWPDQPKPMFSARNIQYEIADRAQGVACGGIGAMHLLARRVGLSEAIDAHLRLLKQHKPYHESDHVLNIAYNLLAGGTRIEHLELRRNDEVYTKALGAERIPDPTTAGDFCRRFSDLDVLRLQQILNHVRQRVWKQQPNEFFDHAVLDADGTIAPTLGECKEGMDITYNGQWGYHPLVISLANTGEPLYVLNRSGNRPSHEGAATLFDMGIAQCRAAGFRKITLRGDTAFSQTKELDGWQEDGVRFIFGIDAHAKLLAEMEKLPEKAWKPLVRPVEHAVKTAPRRKPENVKERIVVEREYENQRLVSEEVAEFAYRPSACKYTYRIVVVRKKIRVTKGQQFLFDKEVPFFYITNDWETPAEGIVREANQRCNQENLVAQLKGGVRAMDMPVDNLTSNWAYLVMASLAWSLKAWSALLLPDGGPAAETRRQEKRRLLRMDFKTFLNTWMQMPCQVVRAGRRLIYRLLSWNPWQSAFFRLLDQLRIPLRC